MHNLKYVVFLASFFFSSLGALIDLESHPDDFILEIKQIIIPDHPYAFNGSIIRWNNRYLLSFREMIDDPIICQSFDFLEKQGSYIGLVELDEHFNPCEPAQLLFLKTPFFSSKAISRASDARLITIDDHLYIIYSDCSNPYLTPFCRIHLGEVVDEQGVFVVKDIECMERFERENPGRQEKNWVPFAYENQLFFAYSLAPHRILKPRQGLAECESYCITSSHLNWPWGEPRGGTPGIQVDGGYLAFFHSSLKMRTLQSRGDKILHYFMGAYMFRDKPPFAISKMSPKPIIGKNFYEGEVYDPYWKPLRAVFPCGILVEEDWIRVTYGRQDHEIWIMKMDKQLLLKSLKPVD